MTTGKVFSGSTDIYQDQAQVLFDYYRQAAERIVAQEQAIEQQAAEATQQRTEATARAESANKMLMVWGIAAVACLLLFFVIQAFALVAVGACAFMAFKQYTTKTSEEANVAQIDNYLYDLQNQMQAIRRDYKVDRIGVAYVPVGRRVPLGDKSYVVDFTGSQPETEFTLTLINQPDELKDAMDELHRHLEDMPVVETNDETEQVDTSDYSTSMQDITLHDYMGTIDREIRTVSYLVDDNRDVSVSIPVVPPASERYQFLSDYSTNDVASYPVVPVFDATATQRKVEDFSSLGALNQQSAEDGSGDVSFFVDVMRQLAQGVDVLSKSRTASVSKITNYSSQILGNVLKASFDQYSPTLEAEEIERIRLETFNYGDTEGEYKPFSLKESSRVRYDIFADAWIADNGSRTSMPFGMHQVDAEVLMPVIQNLMQENRVERLRVYNDIQNQKIDYLNQWHRDTDDFFGRNRAEANELIQRMNEAYAEYTESYTNYEQQRAAIDAMKASGNLEDSEVSEAQNQDEVIAGFQLQTSQARAKQEEFTAFMERIREDIDLSATRFGHVEYYEASLRDSQARENARAAANVGNLDPRRQRIASVNPYLAQAGTIPPEPRVSQKLNDDFVINLSNQVEGEIIQLTTNDQTEAPSAEEGQQ